MMILPLHHQFSFGNLVFQRGIRFFRFVNQSVKILLDIVQECLSDRRYAKCRHAFFSVIYLLQIMGQRVMPQIVQQPGQSHQLPLGQAEPTQMQCHLIDDMHDSQGMDIAIVQSSGEDSFDQS